MVILSYERHEHFFIHIKAVEKIAPYFRFRNTSENCGYLFHFKLNMVTFGGIPHENVYSSILHTDAMFRYLPKKNFYITLKKQFYIIYFKKDNHSMLDMQRYNFHDRNECIKMVSCTREKDK